MSDTKEEVKPKISIVVPSFNKERYISETLDSILTQDFDQWEAIVVDDGSEDKTIDIINAYTKKDDRIRFYPRDREPKGGSVCRNIGIEKSRGEYIIFRGEDDLFLPDTLKNRIQAMEKNPDMDFIVFATGHFYKHIGDCDQVKRPKSDENHLEKFLSYNVLWHTTSCIWKKKLLYQINLFDEEYPRLQDVELHTRALLEKNVHYKIVSDIDFYQRIDPLRIATDDLTRTQTAIRGFELYLNKMYEILKKKNQHNDKVLLNALKHTVYKATSKILNSNIPISHKARLIKNLVYTKSFMHTFKIKEKIVFAKYIIVNYLKTTTKKFILKIY